MTQAKQTPPQTTDRQTPVESGIILDDILYQLDNLDDLERRTIAFLYAIWKAQGISKKIVKVS